MAHWIGCLFSAVMLVAASTAHARPSTILHHGKIFTGDPHRPWAEAIEYRNDRIVRVGSNHDLLRGCGQSNTVDLGGRVVIPGLNDAHVHALVSPGVLLNAPDFAPGPGPSVDDVLTTLSWATSVFPPGTWLVMLVGTAVSEDALANRFTLDAVAPQHPVRLEMWTGHGMYINTAAMAQLGIAEDEPDPFGGSYVRLPSGVITGEVHEYAEFHIRRKLYDLVPDSALIGQYQAFAGAAASLGFTSLQDIPVGLPQSRAVRVLEAADLPVRVRSVCFPLSIDEAEQCGVHTHDPRVTATGIKWILDGTPIERYASVSQGYADRPGWYGTINLDEDALEAALRVSRHGPPARQQPLFHAVGDGAAQALLDALAATGAPHAWRNRRVRLEHGDMLFDNERAAFGAHAGIVVQNGTHLGISPALWAQRLGPAALTEIQPLASIDDAGAHLALGTDGIGQVSSPWLDMFLTIIHPARPDEALTLEQALIAYTRGSAYAEYEETRKGVLKPGMLADFAVLSQDIFALPPGALPATSSVLTVVGGEVVWSTGVLSP